MKKHLGTISTLMCALLLAVPAISTASVTNNQVTSAKINEADNNGSQDTNSGSGVKTGHIQNLAVTGAKIAAGTITSNNIGNDQVTNAILAPNVVTTAVIMRCSKPWKSCSPTEMVRFDPFMLSPWLAWSIDRMLF